MAADPQKTTCRLGGRHEEGILLRRLGVSTAAPEVKNDRQIWKCAKTTGKRAIFFADLWT
jgi:hypothetical protein